jgi:CheY-like chemotaxis protein
VTTAGTAAEATAVNNGRLDIALVDIDLPDGDGYSVARDLRRAHPDALFVAVTGFGQRDDRDRTREAGFDAHLVKPVAPESIELALERARRR